jgi:diacylglycerol kinase family enzyme
MVCIANTRQFGSGAFIAPNAKYNDGLLEVVLIRPLPFYRLPLLIYRLFNGTLANSRYVEFIQTRSVSVKSNSDSYHVDGEPKVMRGPLDISIHGQINVIKTNV